MNKGQKQRLPQLTRARKDMLPGFRLTQRDVAILEALYDYRVLTPPLIEPLFFPKSIVKGKRQHAYQAKG